MTRKMTRFLHPHSQTQTQLEVSYLLLSSSGLKKTLLEEACHRDCLIRDSLPAHFHTVRNPRHTELRSLAEELSCDSQNPKNAVKEEVVSGAAHTVMSEDRSLFGSAQLYSDQIVRPSS